MSTSAGAAPIPTVSAPVDDPFPVLVEWIAKNAGTGDDVRDESYRAALSAVVHRVLKFGFDETLNRLSARDCLNCCLMCGGHVAEFFIRTAFTRGLIENDRLVVDRILQTPFIPESRLWLAKIMAAVQGDQDALADAACWLETMGGEERAIASLLIGRIIPDLIQAEWLPECPLDYPRLAAEIALLLQESGQYDAVVKAYLRNHPEVRYSVDDERWNL